MINNGLFYITYLFAIQPVSPGVARQWRTYIYLRIDDTCTFFSIRVK